MASWRFAKRQSAGGGEYKIDFIGQILLGQPIEVLTRVVSLGNKSLKMTQWVIEQGAEEPLSVCESVMAGFQRSTGTSFVLPDEWREAINGFEK
ncbi:acyl-CoA thioesterase [Marinilabilia salmonicolor]|uniref:acyl-CoA thioesterase n=1 Tax=Marinilabilia salmonicolor TaxID=989 RepID=UPI0009DE4F85